MTETIPPPDDTGLRARLDELERTTDRLHAMVALQGELLGSLHFVDIVQAVTRHLGERFGLDRCAIFLATAASRTARLVASYEDPSIRQWDVELDRYPEVREALETGEIIFITDVQADPRLKHVQGILRSRQVRSITVVPMLGPDGAFGVIFLRTFESGAHFTSDDIGFIQDVAVLTARALDAAAQYAAVLDREEDRSADARRASTRHALLLAYLGRLLDGGVDADVPPLSATTLEELDRLVDIAQAVIAEESKAP
jgi:GAF domain-containing protein